LFRDRCIMQCSHIFPHFRTSRVFETWEVLFSSSGVQKFGYAQKCPVCITDKNGLKTGRLSDLFRESAAACHF
ncbi:MAG: hypothetical protein DRI57_19830, partial [Deltaproteobacteria bacterium]